jgi:hypothetical protein
MVSGKKIDDGELFASIIQLTTDNDKILIDVSPEDQQAQKEEQLMAEQEAMIQGQEQPVEEAPLEQPVEEPQVSEEDEVEQYVAELMEQYEIDEPEARAMVEAEAQGFSPEEIMAALSRRQGAVDVQG